MIGIDLVEVARISESEAFVDKIALEGEKTYLNSSPVLKKQRIAALFSLKEAVMKALEMGKDSGVVFKDIELYHEENGKPCVRLHGKALEKFENCFSGKNLEVSISHIKDYATAIAMII